MAYGQNTKSERILQMVPESAPGTLDVAAPPVVLSNLAHEWTEEDGQDNWRGAGRNHDAFNAVIEEQCNVGGELVPYYNLLDAALLPYVFGAAASDVKEDGARTRVYESLRSGRIDRPTFTLEEGLLTLAKRAGYGLVVAWSINSERGNGGKTRGNVSMIARKCAEGVEMSLGDHEQDEIQTLTLDAVESARTIGTPGGDTFDIALGADEATVQAAARATDDAEFDAVVVTADIVASALQDLTGAGTSSFSGAFSGDHVNMWDNNPSTASWQSIGAWQGYDIGSSVVINSYSIQIQNEDGTQAPTSWTLKASNTGAFTGEEVTLDTKAGSTDADWANVGSGKRRVFSIVNSTAYRYYRLTWTGSTSEDIVVVELELGVITYSGTYTFTFPSSVGNVGPMVPGDDDVTIETTQQGNPGGDNRLIVEPLPILPKHWKVYFADDHDGLDDVNNYVATVKRLQFGEENAVNGFYSHDTDSSYTSHVDGGDDRKRTFGLAIPTSDSVCAALVTAAKAYPSTPRWVRFEATCPTEPYSVSFDFYGSIGATPTLEEIENVEHRQFNFNVLDHPDGDSSIIVTTVVADE